MKHPRIPDYSARVWSLLYHALNIAEETHWTESRKSTLSPYMIHIVEMISEYIVRYPKKFSYSDLLTLALHDALETKPEIWSEIYQKFGRSIFRNVLMLSTG